MDYCTALERVAIDLHQRLEKSGVAGQTLTLKVKFADYSQVTRCMTQASAFVEVRWSSTNLRSSIQESSLRLINGLDLEEKFVRLLGLEIGKLMTDDNDFQQLKLDL